jgi:GNAT superfamily N-acetyltransferase
MRVVMAILGQEEQDLKALEAGWADLGVEIDAGISADIYGRKNLHLSRIEVRKDLRGRGLGTRAMEDLVGLADHYGMLMTLSPATDFGATSKERLRRFYRRFGFVNNKGRRKDFTLFDSMYRLPGVRS